MRSALEHLPCPDSALARLDVRWRLAALAVAAAVAAALQTLPATALAALGALLLALAARLPRSWYLARIGVIAPFFVLLAVLLPLLVRGPGPIWEWGSVRFSWYGARVALVIVLKALAVLTLMLVVLATAPLNRTLHAAHSLRVPGLLVQLALLTYRYVFLLAAELARLRVALRVRGYRNRPNLHSYRTVGHAAGTLLVRSHEQAERVGQAMRCRGFDGRFRSLAAFRTTPTDVAFFLIVTGAAAALLAGDLHLRGVLR